VITSWTSPTMQLLGRIGPVGVSPQIGGNITLLWLLLSCPFFFFIMRSGWTVALILTLNGSNDVFTPKDGPFGGQDDGWRHVGKYASKTPQKGAWIGSFKPKLQNIYIAISPELLIQRISDLRTEFRPWNALRGWSAISPKQLQHGWRPPSENRYDVIVVIIPWRMLWLDKIWHRNAE